MNIKGLQKLSLLDFPGHLACTIFSGGCNYRCPFCHNAPLVLGDDDIPIFTEDEVLKFLRTRKRLLHGVVITGGEPLLYNDIDAFLTKIKAIGFSVKLDTNGTFPDRLSRLVEGGLVDYVAMDIKNSPEKYAITSGVPDPQTDRIKQSVSYLMSGVVDYEFRTTVVRELHNMSDFDAIGKWLFGAKQYFLQSFKDSGNLIGDGYSAYTREEMQEILTFVRKYVPNTEIRGE